jgi:hypothetical protein
MSRNRFASSSSICPAQSRTPARLFHDLHHRFESSGHLLFYGIVQQTGKGVSGTSWRLVGLNPGQREVVILEFAGAATERIITAKR